MAGYLLARLIVSFVFIPAYYRHNVVSIYEFLENRFGPRTRRLASAVFLVTRSLASGSRLWVPTILLVVIWDRAHPGHPLVGMQQFYFTGAVLILCKSPCCSVPSVFPSTTSSATSLEAGKVPRPTSQARTISPSGAGPAKCRKEPSG
jgi:hypothetical protein